MINSAKILSDALYAELKKGYDIVRISRMAFHIYQKYGKEFTPELDDTVLKLIAMEEGPEFEFSEDELKRLAEELASQ